MAEEAGVVVRVESSPRDGELAQRVEARTHTFLADEPAGTGDDLGATPYELLLAARIFSGHHRTLAHSLVPAQDRSYFVQLNTIASDLHLLVEAS